jgi:hypothetical protein
LLLLLEVKSIYQDRNEHEAEFETTVSSMEKLMPEATGDNSHIYFEVTEPTPPSEITLPGIAKGYVSATAIPLSSANFPSMTLSFLRFVRWVGYQSSSMETFFLTKLGGPGKVSIYSFRLRFHSRI